MTLCPVAANTALAMPLIVSTFGWKLQWTWQRIWIIRVQKIRLSDVFLKKISNIITPWLWWKRTKIWSTQKIHDSKMRACWYFNFYFLRLCSTQDVLHHSATLAIAWSKNVKQQHARAVSHCHALSHNHENHGGFHFWLN